MLTPVKASGGARTWTGPKFLRTLGLSTVRDVRTRIARNLGTGLAETAQVPTFTLRSDQFVQHCDFRPGADH